eukprot:3510506-Amphidinium_carterae.3
MSIFRYGSYTSDALSSETNMPNDHANIAVDLSGCAIITSDDLPFSTPSGHLNHHASALWRLLLKKHQRTVRARASLRELVGFSSCRLQMTRASQSTSLNLGGV